MEWGYLSRLGKKGKRIDIRLLPCMIMGGGWEVDILDYTLLI